MSPSAKIIADSISPDGVRLTTMEVVIHRFVLAEFNTHRVFSRNSASSRAIPVKKQMDRVLDDLAWPVVWPAEQKGMQGGEPLSEQDAGAARELWREASLSALRRVNRLVHLGSSKDRALHKSLVNRLLEPFMWHTVVVTSTAWENFFALRTDKDAQPEIRLAATTMEAAYRDHQPTLLIHGEWHTPYVTEEDEDVIRANVGREPISYEAVERETLLKVVRVSAARCARVSYLTHDGKRDYHADLDLYDRLITDRVAAGLPVHWSPAEHVATPWPKNRQDGNVDPFFIDHDKTVRVVSTQHLPRVGNLLGWRSLRTTIEAIQKERTYR